MNVKSKWEIDMAMFNAAMDQAVQRQRRASQDMKRESAGLGDAFARGLGGLQSLLGAAGITLGLSGISQAIKGALTEADDLADLGLKLKESTEVLQRMDFVAQQTASVGIEQLANGMVKLEKNLGDVENAAARDALARLGLTAGQLVAMPLDQKMFALADAFQQARASGTGVADIMDLMGRSAPELIPMLEQTGDALRGLADRAPIVSDLEIERMAVLNDQLDEMAKNVKSVFMGGLGQALAGWEIYKDLLHGVNPTIKMDAAASEIQERMDARDQSRRNQAKAIDDNLKQQEADAAAKKAADAAEKVQSQIDAAADRVNAAQLAALPPDQRLRQLTDPMLAPAGLQGSGSSGLEFLLRGQMGGEDRVKFLEALEKALQIEKEIADGRVRTEQEIAALREQAAAGEFRLLSPAQQGETLRRRLGVSFGVDIQSAQQVTDGLAALKKEAEAAALSGDPVRERAALQKLRQAQDDAAALGGLNLGGDAPGGGGGFQANGEVARTFNLLFDRSANSPVLEESKKQTIELEKMNKVLNQILDKTGDTFEDF